MKNAVIEAITTRFATLYEFVNQLNADMLNEKLPVPKSKSLGEHLWCIVGARESYTRALAQGQWSGFACSLDTLEQGAILDALHQSAQAFAETVQAVSEWHAEHDKLLLALLEHECMHEGQIIRHVYGLGYTLPASWKWA